MPRTPAPASLKLLLALIPALSLLAVGPGADALATPRTSSSNAVYDHEFADPFVLHSGETYFAFSTNSDRGNVPVISSPDLKHWKAVGDALPVLPSWAVPGRTWAPAVLQLGSRYVLYYTVRTPASGTECISRAVASRPEGPYLDGSASPLVCQAELGGSIDASPFIDLEGRPHLAWKADTWFGRSSLWSQPLSPDGLTRSGKPALLLTADQAWEANVVEAPSMVPLGGRYLLFFAGNRWDSARYATGIAFCDTPSGPCLPSPGNPVLSSTSRMAGPGGAEFFRGPGGALYIAYHAWNPAAVGYRAGGHRTLRIGPAPLL